MSLWEEAEKVASKTTGLWTQDYLCSISCSLMIYMYIKSTNEVCQIKEFEI